MANWSAQGPIALHGTPLDASDTAQRYPILTRARDVNGAEHIYLKGVASTAKGDWVVYDEVGVTARITATTKGPVAVAGNAHVAGNFGWYQIWGNCTYAVSGDVADSGNLYAFATAGAVDDAVVVGDRIHNAMAMSADDTSDTAVVGWISAQLDHPSMTQLDTDNTAGTAH